MLATRTACPVLLAVLLNACGHGEAKGTASESNTVVRAELVAPPADIN
jgi:hypothetical protein